MDGDYIKKILSFLIIIISLFNVKAITLDTSPITLNIGETKYIDIYADFGDSTSLNTELIYYDEKVFADLYASNNVTITSQGITYTITKKIEDKGNILIGRLGITENEGAPKKTSIRIDNKEIIVNVNITEPKTDMVITTTGIEEDKTSLLTGISSKIVKIALRENVYEYNISIDSDIEELDLKPITRDINTQVEISTQVIKNLEDNRITITAKNGDREEQYIIKVRVRPEIKEEVKIEKTNYKLKYLAFILIFGIIIVACVFLMKREKE